jgi:NAD(P)-dependent dehydrogenase (short-subunit alcohol dehydrogenase family)
LKLEGKTALITGASQGFGLAVARAFVAEGASVMMCARGRDELLRARDEVQTLAKGNAQVASMIADVSRPEQVKDLTDATIKDLGGLDVVVCNAGVYGPKGAIADVSWAEWEQAFAINVYGTVLVCREALAHMKARRRGKIILLSGGGATKPMPNLSAYAASKAAVVRFGETLAQETESLGIDVNAVAPGALNTRLLDEVLDAGPEKVGQPFYDQSRKQKAEGGTPASTGAALCVFLASEESNGITGKLISAVWDPWKDFGRHLEQLQKTDVYTLRRIVPEDRGFKLG